MMRGSDDPPKYKSLRESMIEPIENESEFYKLEGVSMIEERNESQVEALKGNQPVKA
jgi:hypothetical protein